MLSRRHKKQSARRSEEQLGQMAMIHAQAPWLYPERQTRSFFPPVRRPSFLENEETRLAHESGEMSAMRAHMRDLISQNDELARRLQLLETTMQTKEITPEHELSFSTPNGSTAHEEPKEAERPQSLDRRLRDHQGPRRRLKDPQKVLVLSHKIHSQAHQGLRRSRWSA